MQADILFSLFCEMLPLQGHNWGNIAGRSKSEILETILKGYIFEILSWF